MGLDWHSYIEKDGEKVKPCSLVKAPKLKELPNYEVTLKKIYAEKMKDVQLEKEKEYPHEGFIEYWEKRILDEFIAEEGDKYDCEHCPLLYDLRGADSADSGFLGITVASCDFRGKRISTIESLPEYVKDEAYEDHDPDEMYEFAGTLSALLKEMRNDGEFVKDSYEKYVSDYQAMHEVMRALAGPMLSEEEYGKALHYDEQAMIEAIRWLKICAEKGVHMTTSY